MWTFHYSLILRPQARDVVSGPMARGMTLYGGRLIQPWVGSYPIQEEEGTCIVWCQHLPHRIPPYKMIDVGYNCKLIDIPFMNTHRLLLITNNQCNFIYRYPDVCVHINVHMYNLCIAY